MDVSWICFIFLFIVLNKFLLGFHLKIIQEDLLFNAIFNVADVAISTGFGILIVFQ